MIGRRSLAAGRGAAVLSALLALLLFAGVAAAAPAPIKLTDEGGDPEVAVDDAGTAYVVWNQGINPGADVTHFCKIPRGGTACTGEKTFLPVAPSPSNNEDFAGPRVFLPAPGTVIVVTNRCCGFSNLGNDGTFIYTSTDGGASFTGQQLIGSNGKTGWGDVVFGPGNAISAISDVVTAGTFFQHMPLAATTTQSANLGDGPSQSYSGSIALLDATTPLATFDDLETTFVRKWNTGDYNTIGSWGPTGTVGPGTDGTLEGGQSGAWLLYKAGTPGRNRYVARRWNGSGFDAQVPVSELGDPIFADLFQHASGRLYALWSSSNPRVLTLASSPNGSDWTKAQALIAATPAINFFNLQVAAAGDSAGWAAWDSNGSRDKVYVVPFTLSAAANEKDTSVTVGESVVTLVTPRTCVALTDKLVARLSVRARSRSRRNRSIVVKVRQVDFYVDDKRRKKDQRSPFKATLALSGLTAGSSHTIRAKVFIKIRTGPRRTRSIRSSFKVC